MDTRFGQDPAAVSIENGLCDLIEDNEIPLCNKWIKVCAGIVVVVCDVSKKRKSVGREGGEKEEGNKKFTLDDKYLISD